MITNLVLETTEIYSPTILESRSLKSRGQQGHAPSRLSGGILRVLQRPQAPLGYELPHLTVCFVFTWPSDLCVYRGLYGAFVSVSLCPLLFS